MDVGAQAKEHHLGPDGVRRFLSDNPDFLRDDPSLLAELGLRPDAANVVDFGPAALARVHEAHRRESSARKHIEATARANFSAQAQTHGAVVDMLESVNHADLARRVDELSQQRFGLAKLRLGLGVDRRVRGHFADCLLRCLAKISVDHRIGGIAVLHANRDGKLVHGDDPVFPDRLELPRIQPLQYPVTPDGYSCCTEKKYCSPLLNCAPGAMKPIHGKPKLTINT